MRNFNYKNKGYTIEVELPEECGHEGYTVECTYKYVKAKDKYLVAMWIKRYADRKNKVAVYAQEVDTQYLSGKKETIAENICRVVEQASLSGFFEESIQKYERVIAMLRKECHA